MRDSLFDGRGGDPELDALEAALRPLRFDRSPPPLEERPPRSAPQLAALPATSDDAWLGLEGVEPAPSSSSTPATSAPARPSGEVAPTAPPRGAPRGVPTQAPRRRRGVVVTLTAILVGGVAFSLQRHWEERAARASGSGGSTSIVVTARDLPAGAVLTADMLETRPLPERFLTPAVVRAEALEVPAPARGPVGDRLLLPLQAGEPLLWSQLESTPPPQRLSSRVLRGARAVALAPRHGPGSGAQAADRVDLVAALVDPRSGQSVAVIVVQNAVVLAAGAPPPTLAGEGALTAGAGALAVLVSPEEAALLTLAQHTGTVTPALRHPEDLEELPPRPAASLPELLSAQRSLERDARRHRSIGAIRGSSSPGSPSAMPAPRPR